MIEKHLPVVAHYRGGEIRKGYTRNFAFYRDAFDFTEVDAKTSKELQQIQVRLEELKALFYVKDFAGDPAYQPDQQARREGFGERIEVTFYDNETLIGYTHNYKEGNTGFIVYPADEKTNNHIVAVIRSSVRNIRMDKKHSFFQP